jgi:hypothetical protein
MITRRTAIASAASAAIASIVAIPGRIAAAFAPAAAGPDLDGIIAELAPRLGGKRGIALALCRERIVDLENDPTVAGNPAAEAEARAEVERLERIIDRIHDAK